MGEYVRTAQLCLTECAQGAAKEGPYVFERRAGGWQSTPLSSTHAGVQQWVWRAVREFESCCCFGLGEVREASEDGRNGGREPALARKEALGPGIWTNLENRTPGSGPSDWTRAENTCTLVATTSRVEDTVRRLK